MEIRIKTAEEFRDAHVVIEIRAEEDGGIRVRPLVDERLYTASEVGALQASEAELVAKPLQAALAERADRIAELKGEIRRMDHQISAQTERADKLNERNAGLAGELARERDRNAELIEQLARVDKGHVCVADGYPSELDWAAVRAERDEARERAARRERKIEELTAELAREREVVSALRRVYETWEPRIMGEAIRQVRDALGSPSLPEAASEPTSQA